MITKKWKCASVRPEDRCTISAEEVRRATDAAVEAIRRRP
jgi:hypothetical protein